MFKKHPTLIGTLLALSIAALICGKEVKQCLDLPRIPQQSIEMIDEKYLDMLRNQPSVAERINNLLIETIDQLITGAICDISGQPLPENSQFKAIHLGYNKLNNRKIIIGDSDTGSVHLELSEDFKRGYIAKRGFTGYEEVILSPETSKAAKDLFDVINRKLVELSRAALSSDPVLTALSEFLSEVRYGSNEYLCKEYLEIYNRKVTEMIEQIDNEDVRNTVREPLLSLEVTDIRQFLADNGLDPDDVHVID